MKLKEFIQEVRSRACFESEKEALTAVQATLQTFGERLSGLEALELATKLPREIAKYVLLNLELPAAPPSATGFFKRIALREGVDLSVAVPHTRAVMETLQKICYREKNRPPRNLAMDDITPLFEKAVFGSQPDNTISLSVDQRMAV